MQREKQNEMRASRNPGGDQMRAGGAVQWNMQVSQVRGTRAYERVNNRTCSGGEAILKS